MRFLALPGWLQAAGLAGVLVLIAGIGGLAGAYHNLHKAIHRKEAEISYAANRAAGLASLRDELTRTDDLYLQMSDQFEEMKRQLDTANADNDAMRTAIDAAEGRVAALDKTRLALEQRLHGTEQALSGKAGNATELAKELNQSQAELREAELSRATLQKKLADLQTDSQTAGSRTGALKNSLALRESELRNIAAERDRLRAQLKDQNAVASLPPAKGYLGDLEQLVASTGLDLDRLLGRLNAPAGEGGPYIALDPHSLAADRERQEALKGLVQSLPLSAPLDHYQLESGFGPRIDPINHREAFHPGLDLASAYRSPVMATAPGTVTFTGVKPEYGKVVEITHAHGIVTRYAHLHRILVAPGQKVKVHQEIAELGSTGRSTGPHLHYEVIVDGQPLDPAKFMEAGTKVTQINAAR